MSEPEVPPPKSSLPPEPEASSPADGQPAATADGADTVEGLRSRLRAMEQERDQFRELAQRTQADFDNYQKRLQRDLQQERRFSQAPLARDLLPVLDNLERATAAARQAGETGPLVEGVAMVLNQLLDLLRRHGITRIDALGQPFDPNLHQAVMQQPSPDQPANTVLQVAEHGYLIHDRVLRPASVIVAKAE
jgi:molecular chaperone GrpE